MKKWISDENLKNAVHEIHMDQQAKKRIMIVCEKRQCRRGRNRKRFTVIVAFSALLIILFCSPVMAGARESLKQWLSHMTQKEINDTYDSVQRAEAEADSVSRELSWNEKIRKDQLYSLYKKGEMFPDGVITILQNGEEPNAAAVCYDEISATWYFPTQELTDEELLEIIDYEYKMNYSLSIVNESQGVTAASEQIEAKITQEQALEKAKKLIETAYGIDIDPDRISMEEYVTGYYAVKYSGLQLNDGHIENCSILISSQDGKIADVYYKDRKDTSACSKTGEYPDWQKWYEKGKEILFCIAEEPSIKKSYYMVFYGDNSSKDVTKKIYYLYELENGDTYLLGFLNEKGILQSLTYGDSYSEHPEQYQNIWKTSAEKQHIEYKIVEIE